MDEFFPYKIIDEGAGAILVKFRAERCGIPQTKKHEDEITELVRMNDTVKYDLSETTAIGSRWIKLMAKMTLLANSMGKQVLCVGMSNNIRAMSEVIGTIDDLVFDPEKSAT